MTTDSNTSLKLLTPDELADLLRISKVSVYRLVEKREIPVYHVRGSLRFAEQDVNNYLKQNRIEPVELK